MLLLAVVEPAARLVEDQHLGAGGEDAGDREQAPLSGAEQDGWGLGPVEEPDGGEVDVRRLPQSGIRPLSRAEAG